MNTNTRETLIGLQCFGLDLENETPPNRNVKCYSQGNGFYTEKDVVEVFNFIQKNVVAWAQI